MAGPDGDTRGGANPVVSRHAPRPVGRQRQYWPPTARPVGAGRQSVGCSPIVAVLPGALPDIGPAPEPARSSLARLGRATALRRE